MRSSLMSSAELSRDWGPSGARALAAGVDVLVIVDVFSFTTAVDVAVTRGALVYPYWHRDDSAATFARSIAATLAVDRQRVSIEAPYSLSPASLTSIPVDTRLVLQSPNGSTSSCWLLSLAAPSWRAACATRLPWLPLRTPAGM
jgi:2-phosphosulfolactate phosphatase